MQQGPIVVPGNLYPKFEAIAKKYQIPLDLFLAIAHTESGFNPRAEGPMTRVGTAKGMMQFTDPTAKQYGIDPYNVDQALDAAARYLKNSLARFNGDPILAARAYNGGDAFVARRLKTGNFSTTNDENNIYAKRVNAAKTRGFINGATNQPINIPQTIPNNATPAVVSPITNTTDINNSSNIYLNTPLNWETPKSFSLVSQLMNHYYPQMNSFLNWG